MSERGRVILLALGAPNQGKTTLVNRIIERYPAHAGTVRALDPSGNWDWGEWPGSSPARLKTWLQEITGHDEEGRPIPGTQETKHRGLLVLDDCDRYLGGSAFVRDGWRDLFLANRHYWIDLAATAHRPQDVPKQLIGCATELWLFAMEEVNAVDYLRQLPGMGKLRQLPTRPGEALRVRRGEEPKLVKLF